ncbi:MAG: hypothetical protein ACKOB5_07260 [Betaproteobacteria bacterium]
MEGRPLKPVRQAGHALLGVLAAVVLTALGASACLHATTQALLQERAHRQQWEVMQHLISAVEFGPAGLAVSAGWELGAPLALSDGSPCTLDVQRVVPSATDPPGGEHFHISARWADPWGVQQVLTLHSFWHASPRLLPLAAASVP